MSRESKRGQIMESTMLTLAMTTVFLFFIAYIVKSISDNNTRKSIVRDNASPDSIEKVLARPDDSDGLKSLRYGLVSVGIGIALVFIQTLGLELDQPITYGLLFLLGGAGYLIYYLLVRDSEV
jgi:hypothetical protein